MFASPLAVGVAMLALAGQSASALPLSLTCLQKVGLTLVSQPDSTCFATPALAKFLPYFYESTNASIIGPLDTYLGAVCPAPLCSNDTIMSTFNTIESACGSTISSLGVSNSTIATLVPYLPEVKEFVCLESGSANMTNMTMAASNSTSNSTADYCLVDVLNSTQTLIGQNITFSLLYDVVKGSVSLADIVKTANVTNATILSQAVCTDCLKDYYLSLLNVSAVNKTIASNNTIGSFLTQATGYLHTLCGDNFFNASIPANVTNGTNTMAPYATSASATATGLSGLTSLVTLPTAASSLLAETSLLAQATSVL